MRHFASLWALRATFMASASPSPSGGPSAGVPPEGRGAVENCRHACTWGSKPPGEQQLVVGVLHQSVRMQEHVMHEEGLHEGLLKAGDEGQWKREKFPSNSVCA